MLRLIVPLSWLRSVSDMPRPQSYSTNLTKDISFLRLVAVRGFSLHLVKFSVIITVEFCLQTLKAKCFCTYMVSTEALTIWRWKLATTATHNPGRIKKIELKCTRYAGQNCTAQCSVQNLQRILVSATHTSLISSWKIITCWHMAHIQYCLGELFSIDNSFPENMKLFLLGGFGRNFLFLVFPIYLIIGTLTKIIHSSLRIAKYFISDVESAKWIHLWQRLLLSQFRSVIIFWEAFEALFEPVLNTATYAKLAHVHGKITSASRSGRFSLLGSVRWRFTSLFMSATFDKLFADYEHRNDATDIQSGNRWAVTVAGCRRAAIVQRREEAGHEFLL